MTKTASTPRVTVLLAVYNSERSISKCVESILEQSFKDFELLIVDDGSTDQTADIIRRASKKDNRIRILSNSSNLGLGASLAWGVDEAVGEYLIRIDADDVCLPDRLERQVRHLDQNPEVDVLGGAALEVDSSGKQIGVRCMPAEHDDIMACIWANPFIHPTVAFRRRRLLDVGSYDPELRRRQDYELWFRCAERGLRFANLQEPLIYYFFDENTHRKQPLRLALQQAGIGWRGCRRLRLPLWQQLAVSVPLIRALLPAPVQHFLYKALSIVDPRKRGARKSESCL
ncbi:glycosyltransferase [Alkalilimnicola ehrlichii]|uniref:glycosyltransferase n=1 Tax=Alkalilimnicola ehrlichii TaxID=351052 RepID=UPI0015F293A1|nr:glycosyltransferase [Alkalilimnicola ehrlichii]